MILERVQPNNQSTIVGEVEVTGSRPNFGNALLATVILEYPSSLILPQVPIPFNPNTVAAPVVAEAK